MIPTLGNGRVLTPHPPLRTRISGSSVNHQDHINGGILDSHHAHYSTQSSHSIFSFNPVLEVYDWKILDSLPVLKYLGMTPAIPMSFENLMDVSQRERRNVITQRYTLYSTTKGRGLIFVVLQRLFHIL